MEMFSSDEENGDISSQDSDGRDLPDISFSKAAPHVFQDDQCRPQTPVAPGLLRVPTSQSAEISLTSLEHLSPLKATGVTENMRIDAKLLQKSNDLSNDIISKEEMDRKVKDHVSERG